MDFYIYDADVYCEDCAKTIIAKIENGQLFLKQSGVDAPLNRSSMYEYPQGPYSYEESDGPSHCGRHENCLNAIVWDDGTKSGCFLENPLTSVGYKYVREYVRDDPDSLVVRLWAKFYEIDLDSED